MDKFDVDKTTASHHLDSKPPPASLHLKSKPPPKKPGDDGSAHGTMSTTTRRLSKSKSPSSDPAASPLRRTTTIKSVKPPSRLPTLSRSQSSCSSAPPVSPPPPATLPMSSPLPDVAAHAQAAFLMTSAAASSTATGSDARQRSADGGGFSSPLDEGGDGVGALDVDGIGVDFEEAAAGPSSQASLPDVVLRDGDQSEEVGSAAKGRPDEEDVSETESRPMDDDDEEEEGADGDEEPDEGDVLDASVTSAATSSGCDSERNQDSTSGINNVKNTAKETRRKTTTVVTTKSPRHQERDRTGAASSGGAASRRSIKAPAAASRRSAASGSAASSSSAAAAPTGRASPDEKAKSSSTARFMRPLNRGGGTATAASAAAPASASAASSKRTTGTTAGGPKSAASSARPVSAAAHKSTPRKPVGASAAASSSTSAAASAAAAATTATTVGKSSGVSSQAKGRASPVSGRPGSPALSEASSRSSVSGVKSSASAKATESSTTRRTRSSALRQDGPTATSRAARRLKEQQKENIKSRDQNARTTTTSTSTSATTRERQKDTVTASPPKSRAVSGTSTISAAATTTTTSAKAEVGRASNTTTSSSSATVASEGRQSKLPKSISNNSVKTTAANKTDMMAKEERLRKLESELQLKQDLLVAKGNEVSSLEATVAASTATNDALCSEKDGLQAELRRYSICACGLAVVSQYFASLLGASRAQAIEARSTLMMELQSKEAQIVEIEERLGRVEMDLIRSIRDQEQCENEMREQEAAKIEMEEEYKETIERLESEHHQNKILEDRIEEEKRENLRLETELWKIGEAMRSRENKVDAGVNCIISAGDSLQQEVESLKVVLDMKNEELRKIRLQLSAVSNKDQELVEAKRNIQRLEQKVEDLTAMLSSKTDQERQLHQEKQQLRVSLDREAMAKKRISMENEELIYRLSHSSLNDTIGADSLSVSLPSGGHRRTPSVTHSPPSSPMVALGASPHLQNIQSGFCHGMTSSAASPMHSAGSPRMAKTAKIMSRSLGPYDHDSVFQSPSTPSSSKRRSGGATPTSPIDAPPIGPGKGGRSAWEANRKSPDTLEDAVGRRPPVRHSPPLSRHSPPLPRHSETTEPRSSETTTSITNGKSHSNKRDFHHQRRSNDQEGEDEDEAEDEEDSKFPPAPPAVSMADSDSKNGLGIFPQNPLHRDAEAMEFQDHDHDDDTSAAVESLSEGNNGGEASGSDDRKSEDRRRSGTSGSGGRRSTEESSQQLEDDDDEEEQEVVLRRKPGRRAHDTDTEEIEDDTRDDLDS